MESECRNEQPLLLLEFMPVTDRFQLYFSILSISLEANVPCNFWNTCAIPGTEQPSPFESSIITARLISVCPSNGCRIKRRAVWHDRSSGGRTVLRIESQRELGRAHLAGCAYRQPRRRRRRRREQWRQCFIIPASNYVGVVGVLSLHTHTCARVSNEGNLISNFHPQKFRQPFFFVSTFL